jgi:hypothetical protein
MSSFLGLGIFPSRKSNIRVSTRLSRGQTLDGRTQGHKVGRALMEATLLPPLALDDSGEHYERHLDSVGPMTVLSAMIEQRRASQPDPAEVRNECGETPRSHRVPAHSDAFLKAR